MQIRRRGGLLPQATFLRQVAFAMTKPFFVRFPAQCFFPRNSFKMIKLPICLKPANNRHCERRRRRKRLAAIHRFDDCDLRYLLPMTRKWIAAAGFSSFNQPRNDGGWRWNAGSRKNLDHPVFLSKQVCRKIHPSD
jgi:hypothetical protein